MQEHMEQGYKEGQRGFEYDQKNNNDESESNSNQGSNNSQNSSIVSTGRPLKEDNLPDGKEQNESFNDNNSNKNSKNRAQKPSTTIHYSDKEYYTGDTLNKIRHGYGVMTYSDGRTYLGEWDNDQKHGFGREFDKEKTLIFEGKYQNGDYSDGTFHDDEFYYKFWKNSSDVERYVEEVLANPKNQGFNFKNLSYVEIYGLDWSLRYKGGFKKGQLHSYGTYHYSNGNIYTGMWQTDLMHGYGELTFVKKLSKKALRNSVISELGFDSDTRKREIDIHGNNREEGANQSPLAMSLKRQLAKIRSKENKFKSPSLGYDPYSSMTQRQARLEQYQKEQAKLINQTLKLQPPKSPKASSKGKTKVKLTIFNLNENSPVVKDMHKNRELAIPTLIKKVYKGNFVLGKMNGRGEIQTKDGNFLFEGIFKNNQPNGLGLEYLKNNMIYKGEYVNGLKSGTGSIFTKEGELIYDGEFKNGMKNGYGTLNYENGDSYEGHFVNDMKHGAGTFRKPDGSFFKGTWVRNRKMEFGRGRVVGKQKKVMAEVPRKTKGKSKKKVGNRSVKGNRRSNKYSDNSKEIQKYHCPVGYKTHICEGRVIIGQGRWIDSEF